MPNLLLPMIKGVIRSVRSSATSAGGFVSWPFSQMTPPVDTIIKGHGTSAGGICEMLSAKWIECHADDNHLAKWMSSDGEGGNIDTSKVRLLMQLFIIGNDMPSGALFDPGSRFSGGFEADQTVATRKFLESKGFALRSASNPGVATPAGSPAARRNRGHGRRRVLAQDLANEIVRTRNSSGSYLTIGAWGPGGGHAMAAWVAQDVAFFDPNFGEFWFERSADFVAWLPTFWQKSFYSNPAVGLSNRYEVMNYAKAR